MWRKCSEGKEFPPKLFQVKENGEFSALGKDGGGKEGGRPELHKKRSCVIDMGKKIKENS